MRQFLEECKRFIRIRSVSADGNEELSNAAAKLMEQSGMKVQIQHVSHSFDQFSKRQFNVIGILGDPLVDRKTKKGLLLNTHLDTVGPGLLANWTECAGDPFQAVVKDGKIYGLGSADVKLDFLCKLRAIEKFRERRLKMPVYLVGTCGEEVGMFGVKYLIQSHVLNPRYAVVGEPSDLAVVYAHKSLNIFKTQIAFQRVAKDAKGFSRRVDLKSYGKSAHGSYPHLGKNAITQLIDFLLVARDRGFEMRFTRLEGGDTVNRVPDQADAQLYLTSHQFEDFKRFFRETVVSSNLRIEMTYGGVGDSGVSFMPEASFDCLVDIVGHFSIIARQLEKVTDPSFNPSHSTVNLGQIRGTLAGLELFTDMRILPDQQPDAIFQELSKEIARLASKYALLNVTVDRPRHNPGLGMTIDHELVRLCKDALTAAGMDIKLDKKATSTEAAQYFKAGVESVVFGPGISHGNSHSPNEHNIIEHLEKATAFYERLIERICV